MIRLPPRLRRHLARMGTRGRRGAVEVPASMSRTELDDLHATFVIELLRRGRDVADVSLEKTFRWAVSRGLLPGAPGGGRSE